MIQRWRPDGDTHVTGDHRDNAAAEPEAAIEDAPVSDDPGDSDPVEQPATDSTTAAVADDESAQIASRDAGGQAPRTPQDG